MHPNYPAQCYYGVGCSVFMDFQHKLSTTEFYSNTTAYLALLYVKLRFTLPFLVYWPHFLYIIECQ